MEGYDWSLKRGVYTNEDDILENNLLAGKLGFTDEDEEEYNNFTPQGWEQKQAPKKRKKANTIQFDLTPPGLTHPGNSNDSIGSRQTFTSALSSQNGRQKKQSISSSATSTINSSEATSTLTGSHTSISFEDLASKFKEDDVLFQKLALFFQNMKNSPEAQPPRGGGL